MSFSSGAVATGTFVRSAMKSRAGQQTPENGDNEKERFRVLTRVCSHRQVNRWERTTSGLDFRQNGQPALVAEAAGRRRAAR